jgi:hypothetical protein
VALVLVALVGGVVGAGFVVYGTPHGHEGFENPGQPFYGAGFQCMTPKDVQRVIVDGGFAVSWQIEDRDENGVGTTTFSGEPPESGVIEGGFVDGSVAYVLVSVGSGARPHPGCESGLPSQTPDPPTEGGLE